MLHANSEHRRWSDVAPCVQPAPLRPPPCRPGLLPVLLLGLLLAGLGLIGCGAAPQSADEREQELIDYRARHQEMLDSVLVRPGRLEAQRLERERQSRARSRSDWEAVMARQQAFVQEQEHRRQGGEEEFRRLMERQRQYNEARQQARTDDWARFVEQHAPPPAEQGGEASAAGTP